MPILLFELKKTIKNKFILVIMLLSIIFPILLFISNQYNSNTTKRNFEREFNIILNKSENIKITYEEQLQIEDFNNTEVVTEQLKKINSVINNTTLTNKSIEDRDSNTNKFIIQLYNCIIEYEQYLLSHNGISLNLDIPYIKERLIYFQYLDRHDLTYEDTNITTNPLNFLYKIGLLLFSVTGLLILISITNIPIIMEYIEGNYKLLLLEYKGKRGTMFQYSLFQLVLLLVPIFIIFIVGYAFSYQFGVGLLSNKLNSSIYPTSFLGDNNVSTIKDGLIEWISIYIPLILLLNQILRYTLFTNKLSNKIIIILVLIMFFSMYHKFNYNSILHTHWPILSLFLIILNIISIIFIDKTFQKTKIK